MSSQKRVSRSVRIAKMGDLAELRKDQVPSRVQVRYLDRSEKWKLKASLSQIT